MRGLFFSVFFILLYVLALPLQGQSRKLSGLVTDADNQPIYGALVRLSVSNIATTTDSVGRFTVQCPSFFPDTLIIHSLGFETINILINKPKIKPIRITLRQSAIVAGEHTVIGHRCPPVASEVFLTLNQISSAELATNGTQGLSRSLEAVPGFRTVSTGVGISKPVIRGLTQNRIMVVDRGIKHEGQQWGLDHGLEFDVLNLESVSLIRGASTLQYGPDATAGVIYLDEPNFSPSKKMEGRATIAAASNNKLLSAGAKMAYSDSLFAAALRLSGQRFGNYSVPANQFRYNSFLLPLPDGRLTNTGGQTAQISADLKFRKPKTTYGAYASVFNQEVGLFSGAVGAPRAYNQAQYTNANWGEIQIPNQRITHHKYQFSADAKLRNGHTVTQLGFQQNIRGEYSFPHTHGRPLTPSGNMAHGLQLNTFTLSNRVGVYLPHQKLEIGWGANLQHQQNQRKGYEFIIPDFKQTQLGAFGYMRKQYNRLTYQLGLRFDGGWFNANQFTDTLFFDPENPEQFWMRSPRLQRRFWVPSSQMAISYEVNHWLTTKLNLASGARLPAPAELSLNGVHHGSFRHEQGDALLNPERGYQSDLSVDVKTSKFDLTVSPFYNYFQNYIYLSPLAQFSTLPGGGQVYKYKQNRVLHSGFEVSAKYKLFNYHQLSFAHAIVNGTNLDTDLPLPLMPPARTVFGFLGENVKIKNRISGRYGVFATYNAPQNQIDRNEFATKSSYIFDAEMGIKLPINQSTVDIMFKASNITNAPQFDHISRLRFLDLPEQGRNFQILLAFYL